MAISDELRKLVDPNNDCCCEHCLGNECKEWAFNNGFGLVSGLLNHSKIKIAVLEGIDFLMPKISFVDNTEANAIFKACQWVFDRKNKDE